MANIQLGTTARVLDEGKVVGFDRFNYLAIDPHMRRWNSSRRAKLTGLSRTNPITIRLQLLQLASSSRNPVQPHQTVDLLDDELCN